MEKIIKDKKGLYLEDRFEDAAFALCMHDRMQKEGEELLKENEQLSSSDTDESSREKDLKVIRRAFSKQARYSFYKTSAKIFSRVAVVFLVISILFAIPFFTVSAFRAKTMNFIIEMFGEGSYLKPEESTITPRDGEGNEADGLICHPTWVPEGFAAINSDDSNSVMYMDSQGNTFLYSEAPAYTTSSVDTEDADTVETVDIDGFSGKLIIEDENIFVIWVKDKQNIESKITAFGIDPSIVLQIADSVK